MRIEIENSEHFRRLERMYASEPCTESYCSRATVGDGRAEVVIPLKEKYHHCARAAHGSVYFKALDDATYLAVNSLVTDFLVLTASFNIYMTRPVSKGEIRAVGRVVNRSRRLYLAEGELFDSEGQSIGRGSGSFMVSKTPLSPDLGYA